jgi:hypothetical protein
MWTTLGALAILAAASSGGSLVQGDTKTLIVQAEDLPGSFKIAKGDYDPAGGYSAMFFRPEVLAASEMPGGGLMGVMAKLAVRSDVAAAEQDFVASGGLDVESIKASLTKAQPAGSPADVRKARLDVEGADGSAAFRVDYVLQGTRVIEYRYRMLVGNAVANLIIMARAGREGAEPTGFEAVAEKIAKAQVDRLTKARKS